MKTSSLNSKIVFVVAGVCCFALLAGAKSLQYTEDSLPGEEALPEGCGNPFVESKPFFEFFEASIAFAAAERGPDTKGVAELFAVSELERDLIRLVPNLSEESPIDKLVRSQVCHYLEIYEKQRDTRVKKKKLPTSDDPGLHDHLVKIAPKLFEDSLKVVEAVVMEQAAHDRKKERLSRKLHNIRKARRLGRAKVDEKL